MGRKYGKAGMEKAMSIRGSYRQVEIMVSWPMRQQSFFVPGRLFVYRRLSGNLGNGPDLLLLRERAFHSQDS